MSKRIIFIKTVSELVGRCSMSIYRYIQAGDFPQPRKIQGKNAWLLSDVEQWIDEKMGITSDSTGSGK